MRSLYSPLSSALGIDYMTTIDPQITAALIGGIATIAAVVIGWWLHERKSHRKISAAPKSTKADSQTILTNQSSFVSAETKATSSQLTECPVTSLSKITVKEIVESINSAPPFQKEKIAQQYNGITVNWTGHLKEAMEDPRDKESVHANFTINQDTYIGESFWFSEKVVNFPEIRSLKRGSAVSVVGKIMSASGSGLCVTLKPIAIEVLENNS